MKNDFLTRPDKDEALHPLQVFISSLEQVSKMKKQPTAANCTYLLAKYREADVKDVLIAMDNTPNIARKYVSVCATCHGWLAIRKNEWEATNGISGVQMNPEMLPQ